MFDLNYFKYLLKKNKHAFIYIGIIVISLFLFPLFSETVIDDHIYTQKVSYIGDFISLTVTIFIISFIVPFINFSHKFNKRAIDLYDALPIRKEKMLTTLLVFQVFELIIPYIISSVIGIIMIKGSCEEIMMLLGYGILTAIIVSTINTAIIFKTNSIFDGVVMIFAYHVLPFVMYASAYITLASIIKVIDTIPYINNITCLSPFVLFIRLNDVSETANWLYLAILLIYFVIACISLYRDFINRKPEKVEGISEDFFAYRFIINIYLLLVSLMIAAAADDAGLTLSITLFAALIVVFVFADFIYTRKIKINLRKILKALLVIALSIGIVKFITLNKAFGIDKIYPENYSFIRYSYFSNVVLKDSEGNLYEGGIDFYNDRMKSSDLNAVSNIQSLQNILSDKAYEKRDNYYYHTFNVDYYNEKYNPTGEYLINNHLAGYNYYNVEFEDLKDFLMNSENESQFIGNIYCDEDYKDINKTYEDYEEFFKEYTIVSYDGLEAAKYEK